MPANNYSNLLILHPSICLREKEYRKRTESEYLLEHERKKGRSQKSTSVPPSVFSLLGSKQCVQKANGDSIETVRIFMQNVG
jgi:hypothetical protein